MQRERRTGVRLRARIRPAAPETGNPPGLAAIAYRSGTHGTVLRRMLAALGGRLQGAGPAATDDPAVALLDAWATVADVVTFYQERIANEGFLRTATERRSVLELARASATSCARAWPRPATWTSAMQVPAAPPTAGHPGDRRPSRAAGHQVLSVPAQGKLPQTFETTQEFTAERRPQRDRAAAPAGTDDLEGATKLLTSPGRHGGPSAWATPYHHRGATAPSAPMCCLRDEDHCGPERAGRLRQAPLVTWDDGLISDYGDPEVYAFGLRASIFGYNAPAMASHAGHRRGASTGDTASDGPCPAPATGWEKTRTVSPGRLYPDIRTRSFLVLKQPGTDRLLTGLEAVPDGEEKFAISAKTSVVTLDRKDRPHGFEPPAGHGVHTRPGS